MRIVLQDIATKLNLSESPPVENLPLDEAKRYLARNKLKFCVLVVDAETIKGATDKSKVEYEELLETAANEVGKIRDHCPKSSRAFRQTRQLV